MVGWILKYGVFGVGLAAFVGATLLPISSEVAVVAALKLGLEPWHVFLSASIGNALGASLDYGLGRLLSSRVRERLEGSRGGRHALGWMQRYGRWSLLGSWLPIVGDPLCLAAGLLPVRWYFFVTVGIGTRIARYLVLVLVV